jgi:hypothetical protein
VRPNLNITHGFRHGTVRDADACSCIPIARAWPSPGVSSLGPIVACVERNHAAHPHAPCIL